jgi:hypothetical protein
VLDPSFSDNTRNRVVSFVSELWDVFNEAGVKAPVQGHEMVIDTGNHKPVSMQKPHCGMMHKAPIMQKTVNKSVKMGFFALDSASPWGFRMSLAPRPHQELAADVEEHIW